MNILSLYLQRGEADLPKEEREELKDEINS